MRIVLRTLGLLLTAFLSGPVPGQEAADGTSVAKPRVYALMSAVGRRFSYVWEVFSTGSHLPPYRRGYLDSPDNTLDLLVLRGLDQEIAKLDPLGRRVYLAHPDARADRVAPALREQAAIDAVLTELEKDPRRGEWDRIVVVTPAYRESGHDGMAEKLHGLGVFLEPVCQGDAWSCDMGFRPKHGPVAKSPDGQSRPANYFVAPYSFIAVWVLDPKTLAVLDKHEVFRHQKLHDPLSDAVNITRNVGPSFLALEFTDLVGLSVREAVRETVLRGKVEVGNVKPVGAPAAPR
jgi:hypothetical protein